MTPLLFTAGAVKYLDVDTVQPVAYSASSQSSAATSSLFHYFQSDMQYAAKNTGLLAYLEELLSQCMKLLMQFLC